MRNLICLIAIAGLAPLSVGQDSAGIEFFEKKIRPVLAQQCYKCHSASAAKLKAGLLLDSRDAMLKGGESGPSLVPGKPAQSLLIKAIQWNDKDLQMPKEKLADGVIADFVAWVQMGAPWPKEPARTASADGYAATYDTLRKELWSWQPISNPAVPQIKDDKWSRDDIDRFVLAKLTEKELKPSPEADKLSLLRRVTFDLTGLPPTPDEIDAFLRDNSPTAFERVVDRLLASRHFGERWGRHWLDVARYAESSGMTRNLIYFYAWRYRDYVIESFNSDKPYNRFIREQIAGDLLPAKNDAEKDRNLIATSFLCIGPRDYNERNPRQFLMNSVDEQIDTVGRAVLATTIACARCHDHKFDPIPTAQYYSLAGIFASSDEQTGLQRRRGAQFNQFNEDELIKLSGYTPAEKGKVLSDDELRDAARDSFRKLFVTSRFGSSADKPASTPPKHLAMGVVDAPRPGDINILVRGELDQPGERVARGFLSIPCMESGPVISANESGRLELAIWLTRKDNPLTARVMANRIWQHLFGFGLVRSVDNFGTTGEKPSHPQLLDHLASRFMENGWSVKKLIRSIVLSSTYQQAATFDRAKYNVDPDNHYLWRMNQRRLEAEAIRDTMLSASGKLVTAAPVGSVVLDLPPIEIRTGRLNPSEMLANSACRSVYLPIFRNATPDVLEVFDFADATQVTGARDVTTVAPQALYMLNNSFVANQAQAMAIRLINQGGKTDAAKVDQAYKLALGRLPYNSERDRALSFVNSYFKEAIRNSTTENKAKLDAWSSFCQALFASAEFRYLN